MIGLALAVWALSWVMVSCLNYAAARQVTQHKNYNYKSFYLSFQVFHIRCRFLKSVLRQDIAWYDTNTANDFASRMTE